MPSKPKNPNLLSFTLLTVVLLGPIAIFAIFSTPLPSYIRLTPAPILSSQVSMLTSQPNWTRKLLVPLSTARIFIARTPNTQYAYCSVGKAGCTFHLGIIHRMHGTVNYEITDFVHNRTVLRQWHASAVPPRTLETLLLNDSFPKYVVVRNPIMRTLSAYRNKVEAPIRNRSNRTPENFHSWVFDQFPSGRERTIEELARLNIHWMPQYIHCGMHTASFFTVFKFEDSSPMLDFIYRIVPNEFLDHGWGGDRNLSFREFQQGPRERSGHNEDNFFKYYSRLDVFDRVKQHFQRDIDKFGYGEDVLLMREQLVAKLARANDNTTADGR